MNENIFMPGQKLSPEELEKIRKIQEQFKQEHGELHDDVVEPVAETSNQIANNDGIIGTWGDNSSASQDDPEMTEEDKTKMREIRTEEKRKESNRNELKTALEDADTLMDVEDILTDQLGKVRSSMVFKKLSNAIKNKDGSELDSSLKPAFEKFKNTIG